MNTNRNLARATTKSKSETQTVSNGHVIEEEERDVFEGVSQCQKTLSNEQDRSQVSSKVQWRKDL